MKKLKLFALGLVLCIAWTPAVFGQEKSSDDPILVGRITFVEGQLLRYVYAEQDWVATVKDAPFGLDDALYSNDQGKAEFKLPNGTWVRAGADTQLQLIALRDDVTEIDVAAGMTRFYNKSKDAVLTVTTPFGYAVVQPGMAFDLYVGDGSADIICLDGTADFVLQGDKAKFTVEAGGSSIISDGKQTVEGDGTVESDWDEWNLKREQLWAQRVQVKGESVQYLPESLQEDAPELDKNGKWEKVQYEGEERTMWRPANVEPDWRPFTAGRWTVYHEDNCWIPEEEYGYVTHHYGNWVYIDSYAGWYWAPPVRVRVGYIADYAWWYPGRVAWIHTDADIGWIPLAPTEVYYSHHHWGPAAVFIGVGIPSVSISINTYRFWHHAVVINQPAIYTVNNYRPLRITNISNTTIINNFRAAPVINNTVINNYTTNRNRFVYNTNLANVAVKPHGEALSRINTNRALSLQQAKTVSAKSIQQRTAQIGKGQLLSGPQGAQAVQRPKLSSKMVAQDKVNLPKSQVQFREKQLKAQGKPPQAIKTMQRPGGTTTPTITGPAVKGPRKPITPGERIPHGVQTIKPEGKGVTGVKKGATGVQKGVSGAQKGVGKTTLPGEKRLQKGSKVGEQKRLRQEQRLQRSEKLRQDQLKKRSLQEPKSFQRPTDQSLRKQQLEQKRFDQPKSLQRDRRLEQQNQLRLQQQQKLQGQRLQRERTTMPRVQGQQGIRTQNIKPLNTRPPQNIQPKQNLPRTTRPQ